MSTPSWWMETPDHFPMGVDLRGRGPVMEHDPAFAGYECWCGRSRCGQFDRLIFTPAWLGDPQSQWYQEILATRR